MLRNGLAMIRLSEGEVNKLNVFPVADGDTGTNMAMTLENGIRSAESRTEAGAYLKKLSEGMLLGARGNSGVILSQFFNGFFTQLSRCGWVNPGEFRDALIRGYKTAYSAVVKPVEGTILTVTREGIEHIRGSITRGITFETLLTLYIAEMRKSLAATPELLPVLKESGVVDSGAYGFILIVEGMLKYLQGEQLETEELLPAKDAGPSSPDLSLFNENSVFEHGYCCEFILQLMTADRYTQRFRLSSYIEDLQGFGESLVVVQDGRRVKVHVHTFKPAKVIALSQEYGEFLTFKLENMQLQHNEVLKADGQKKPHRSLSVVSVVNGAGLAETFEGLGCDCVIRCEETMNASTQEFLDAFGSVDADAIVVLPNNKNVILAAEQAVSMAGANNIFVLPTRSIAEGYYAIAMDVPDSEDAEYRIRQMRSGLEDIVTLTQTVASRDYTYHELTCRTGDELVLLNDEIVCVSNDWCDSIIKGLAAIPDIEEKESCVIFRGADVPEEYETDLEERIGEEYPDLEISFLDGGQKIYRWILGIC